MSGSARGRRTRGYRFGRGFFLPALAAGVLFLVSFRATPSAGTKDQVKLEPEEQKLLDLTNQARKEEGRAPLKSNPLLVKAARAHSANMAKQGKMVHVLDNKDAFDRISAAGYHVLWVKEAGGNNLESVAGENLAVRDPDRSVADVMDGLMKSPTHKAHLLDSRFTEIGVGAGRTAKGQVYYTQVFAAPQKQK
jgi:uncharacterized protein YkwD